MVQIKKLELLKIWKSNIFREFTISEIMLLSNKKTKPWVFNALKDLNRLGFITIIKKETINCYKLAIDNFKVFQAFQFLEVLESKEMTPTKITAEIITRVPIRTYALLIFGSYASNNARISSDLDICFLVDSVHSEKKIRPYIEELKLELTINLDVHYITFDDFIKMLKSYEENLAKEIYRKHVAVYNSDIYYSILREANKNGFKPEDIIS